MTFASYILMWTSMFAGLSTSMRAPNTEPLEVLRTRHIAVQTKINGEGPFRLVLDTGAPITFINRRLAAKLGLIKSEVAARPMMLGMGGQVRVKSVEVGAAKAGDVPVIILDHPIVEMVGQVEGGIDGIIGYTFWSRFRMTLDYQARKVTFEPNGYEPQDVLASLLGRLMRADDRPPVSKPAPLWGVEVEERGGKILVKRVVPAWPAHAGGLRAGDRLKTVDRRWTDSLPDLLDAMGYCRPGEPVEVVIVRHGRDMTLTVRPRPGL